MRFNYDECADLLRHGATWAGIFNEIYGVDISYAMEHYAHILAEAVKITLPKKLVILFH